MVKDENLDDEISELERQLEEKRKEQERRKRRQKDFEMEKLWQGVNPCHFFCKKSLHDIMRFNTINTSFRAKILKKFVTNS